MGSELVLDWCHALGWAKNPFSSLRSPSLAGLLDEREQINLFLIKGHRIGYIQGAKGVGKTTLLRWLEEQLRAHKSILSLWVDGAPHMEPPQLAPQVLRPFAGLFSRMDKVPAAEVGARLKAKLAKPYIFLVDNADQLPKATAEWLAGLLAHPHVRVVATQTEARSPVGPDQLNVKLAPLSVEVLHEILACRVASVGSPGIWPFSDEDVLHLAKQAGHNPARFLAACEEKAIEHAIRVRRGELSKPTGRPPPPRGKGFSIKVTNEREPPPAELEREEAKTEARIDTIDFSPREPERRPVEPPQRSHADHDPHKDSREHHGHRLPLPNPLAALDEPPRKEKELRRDGYVLD